MSHVILKLLAGHTIQIFFNNWGVYGGAKPDYSK